MRSTNAFIQTVYHTVPNDLPRSLYEGSPERLGWVVRQANPTMHGDRAHI